VAEDVSFVGVRVHLHVGHARGPRGGADDPQEGDHHGRDEVLRDTHPYDDPGVLAVQVVKEDVEDEGGQAVEEDDHAHKHVELRRGLGAGQQAEVARLGRVADGRGEALALQ
ncbi:hypothetical protein EGW08_008164, partial [Elysia chlorotica]